MSLNQKVLRGFSALLVLAGILGFVLPPHLSLMSGAPAYNWFHIAFGLLGAALAWRGGEREARVFNAGFGLIDLYQIVAHRAQLFPVEQFRWTGVDDLMHLLFGVGLLWVGLSGRKP